MDEIQKLKKVVSELQETMLCSMLMVDAMFELLVEKGILSEEEVQQRIKRLKNEAPPQFRWVQ